jgi:thymidylate synthase ThyX
VYLFSSELEIPTDIVCVYLADTKVRKNFMAEFLSKIIADSINPNGNRVTTFLLTYPRFIHSEIMTHRTFSRNAASSRAIPIEKIMAQVINNPAMPIRWGKNGKGMQDHGSMSVAESEICKQAWINAAKSAVSSASILESLGLHKQIVNRVLEPFMWMTTLVTATEWQNFFSLRLHKDAQPEFQFLAHMMLKEYLGNTPEYKNWEEWHIPFGDKMAEDYDHSVKLKVATARAARTSYLTIEKESSLQNDCKLHDILAASGHWSPFEHSCQAKNLEAGKMALSNFKGWFQYRHTFKEENRTCDLVELLKNYENSIKE